MSAFTTSSHDICFNNRLSVVITISMEFCIYITCNFVTKLLSGLYFSKKIMVELSALLNNFHNLARSSYSVHYDSRWSSSTGFL